MIKYLKSSLHNFNSLFYKAWKEPSTYIGIFILFGWLYYKEIDSLIRKILTSNDLIIGVINGVTSFFGVLMIAIKQNIINGLIKYFKNNNKNKDRKND